LFIIYTAYTKTDTASHFQLHFATEHFCCWITNYCAKHEVSSFSV